MQRLLLLGLGLFATLPATGNYQLQSYGFGSGGNVGSTATYALEGTSGELSGNPSTGASYIYGTKPGFIQIEQARVPKIGTLDNNSGIYYNKLHFALDTQGNPTDATYLISVSTDSAFASNVNYLHSDGTISSTFTTVDYRTYAAWGGASGGLIIGLVPSTTYFVRTRATQGKFSESAFGPSNSVATASPSLTFSLVTSNSNTAPFSVDFGTLVSTGTIYTSSNTIDTTLSTNGTSGGDIYVRSQNGGLLSSSTGNLIDSVTIDLAAAVHGFGAQYTSVATGSGGPLSVVSPFSATGTNIAALTTSTQSLYSSSAPITNGLGKLSLKAKTRNIDVAASDYKDILTFIAAGNF